MNKAENEEDLKGSEEHKLLMNCYATALVMLGAKDREIEKLKQQLEHETKNRIKLATSC